VSGLGAWRFGGRPLARVAINLRPRRSPYGGGNQFVAQLAESLSSAGYRVGYRLQRTSDVVILVDPRPELTTFALEQVVKHRLERPDAVVIHRVNECDLRKGSSGMDERLARANALADHTVFVSGWLRDHHAARWFDRGRPHSVVPPGADPAVFHPLGAEPPADRYRVVTHHWSDNPMKGFAVYAEVDAAIAEGRLPGFELWLIGRWPAAIAWRVAMLHPPARGAALGALLRSCHGYLTASRFDPGPMHVVEGLQCGLPVAYHADGGGAAELAAAAGVAFTDDPLAALRELRARHTELRQRALAAPVSGRAMCEEWRQLVQRLLAVRGAS
jgi:glycosyltransferase involved in cell wall biosynthesis